jgi:uncharacterized membrane protein YgcG
VAAGDLKRLDTRGRDAVEAAVARAEEVTGLQFCVFLGAVDDDLPREHAEAMFVEAGLHERPAILVVVAPKQRRVEIVTGPHARERISDDDAAAAVAAMTASFARGDLAGGVTLGLDQLAASAGPGARQPGEVDITNILDDDT